MYTSAATADIASMAVHNPKSQVRYKKNLWAAYNVYYLNAVDAVKSRRRGKDNFNDLSDIRLQQVTGQQMNWERFDCHLI